MAVKSKPFRPRRRRFIRRKKVCAFCVDKVKVIDWKDANTLKRYIMNNGSMRARHKTGTCAKHQRQLAAAIKRARFVALLPYTTTHARFSGFDRR
ncbi:MAG: 30S ribosomal protein S18 [Anaerolineae bacterium]